MATLVSKLPSDQLFRRKLRDLREIPCTLTRQSVDPRPPSSLSTNLKWLGEENEAFK